MRPFLWAVICSCAASPSLGEAIPAGKADLIRRILADSIRSQSQRNVRGTQMEWVQTPTASNQITFKDYRRSKDGHSLTIVNDTSGRRLSVISDDGTWNKTYDARSKTLTVSRSIKIPADERSIRIRVHRILSCYRVIYVGPAVMAGRNCHKLTLDPHDPHGRPIRVWIDSAAGITLAREESDRRGFSFGMTTFTSVSYPESLSRQATSYTAPSGTREIRVSRSPLFSLPGSLKRWKNVEVILPLSMPRGFEFESAELVSLGGTPTVCLRYSDGLAMITIFQTQTSHTVDPSYQSVAWKMLPRGENVAVSGRTRVTSVVIGPRESDGIVTVARALDRQREIDALSLLRDQYDASGSLLERLRDRGMGVGCIAALLEISRRSRRNVESLLALKADGWDWRQIATRFKVSTQDVAKRIRPFECR